MRKPKYLIDCPLCRCIMRQHPAGHFLCPECKSMFAPHASAKDKLERHAAKPARAIKERVRELSTKRLRELAAVEDKSLLSVGGLAQTIQFMPEKVGTAWIIHVHKQEGQEGFTCFCGQFKPFDSYVYAHMSERLTHECATCKAQFVIKHGQVTLRQAPELPIKK